MFNINIKSSWSKLVSFPFTKGFPGLVLRLASKASKPPLRGAPQAGLTLPENFRPGWKDLPGKKHWLFCTLLVTKWQNKSSVCYSKVFFSGPNICKWDQSWSIQVPNSTPKCLDLYHTKFRTHQRWLARQLMLTYKNIIYQVFEQKKFC